MHNLAYCLLQHDLLDKLTAQTASNTAQQQQIPFTSYLIKNNLLASATLLHCLAQHFKIPIYQLRDYPIQQLSHPIIPLEIIFRYRALPIKHDNHTLTLAMADPTDHAAISAIRFHTGLNITLMLCDESELDHIINTHCRPNILYSKLTGSLTKIIAVEEQAQHFEHTEQDDEPIIEFVNDLIANAIEKRVSDIHIEPYASHCRIRFRQDGLLHEAAHLPPHAALRITTRLKIMANLNIAERRLPQDGRIPWRRAVNVDIRLNTSPTLHGEKIVLRLLHAIALQLDIASLGLLPPQLALLKKQINKPQGLILVTGPTGSGKTVTLYSMLRELNQLEKNISTIEDPVEIELHGINQLTINPQIGLTFPSVLRMLLRQDPDILMVGEIRDTETAALTVQAAQTGHLVLSTLHTNSAAETIVRLQSMGIAGHQLADSLSLVISQRLVRTYCQHCKGQSCERCQQGYQGRTGVFECLAITEPIAACIFNGSSAKQIVDAALAAGHLSLWLAAQHKIQNNLTSQGEILRVINAQGDEACC